MPNLKKTLHSQSELEVTMASFADSHKLLKAVMKEMERVQINFGSRAKNVNEFMNLEVTDETINTLKNIFSRIVSSDEVEAALWPCLERCTWNGRKVNRDLFEDEGPRGDFLEIAKEVLWFNLSPFTQSLGSLFSGGRPAQ
jgi:hypothetical protein